MTMNEIVLLSIYAVASADGKAGSVSKIISSILKCQEQDIQAKIKDFNLIINELRQYPQEAIQAVISVSRYIMHADGIVEESETNLINKLKELLQSDIDTSNDFDMSINEIVLLTIYAVASADGKTGGGVSKIIPFLLNIPEEDIQTKIENFDLVVIELSKYPEEAIIAVISTAIFIMYADGIIEKSEGDIIIKLRNLLDLQ